MMSREEIKAFVEKGPAVRNTNDVVEICYSLLVEQERLAMELDFRISGGVAENPIPATTFGFIGPPRGKCI